MSNSHFSFHAISHYRDLLATEPDWIASGESEERIDANLHSSDFYALDHAAAEAVHREAMNRAEAESRAGQEPFYADDYRVNKKLKSLS